MDVRNNRVYINGNATNDYVCDECGHIVSNLREWGSKQVCSECEEMLDIELEELQEPNW